MCWGQAARARGPGEGRREAGGGPEGRGAAQTPGEGLEPRAACLGHRSA